MWKPCMQHYRFNMRRACPGMKGTDPSARRRSNAIAPRSMSRRGRDAAVAATLSSAVRPTGQTYGRSYLITARPLSQWRGTAYGAVGLAS